MSRPAASKTFVVAPVLWGEPVSNHQLYPEHFSATSWTDCSLLIAHCSLLIADTERRFACATSGGQSEEAVNAKEFSERLWDFAVEVARIVESIPDTRVGRHVAGQLIRCGTSSAPNYDEACDAESRRDFAHKLGIALKELRETSGWLRFLIKFGIGPLPKLNPVLAESMELRKLLGKSLKTLRNRPDFPAPDDNEQ